MRILFVALFIVLFSIVACDFGTVTKSSSMLPMSSSDVDEIMLVMDDSDFEQGPIREFLLSSILEDFPMLPQSEPRFNLHQVPPVDLMPLLRQASTLLYIANLEKEGGTAAVVKKEIAKAGLGGQDLPFFVRQNVWSKPQNVIYFYGENEEDLLAKLKKHRDKLLTAIYELEDEKARNNAYVSGINEGYGSEVTAKFDIKLDIPSSFRKVGLPEDATLYWFREDLNEKISNLMISAVPYEKLETRDLSKLSDQLHEKFGAVVRSDIEGSRMSKDTVHYEPNNLPLKISGLEANLSRGIWIMTNEYMGGPYINTVIDQPSKNRVVFLEAFVYAPRDKKRKLMRRLEQMILGVEL